MNPAFIYPSLLLLPCAFMAVFLEQHDRAQAAKALKLPIGDNEKFLRSPGDSALKKKMELDQKILGYLLLILISPPCLMVAYLSIPPTQRSSPGFWILWAIVLPIYGCLMAYWFRQLSRLYHNRQNWFLGYRGECAVGEHLNQLMLHGCRVFHDFPLNGNGNLDHIVVAPSGVYAIETKTRSKGKPTGNQRPQDVFYNGQRLRFPNWDDFEFVEQAREQAEKLGKFIFGMCKITVEVKPILTLPGWFVNSENKLPHEVLVLNHKQIRSAIVGARPILSLDDIEKISAHLEAECRDVAF